MWTASPQLAIMDMLKAINCMTELWYYQKPKRKRIQINVRALI
jgi:hypothetical protein